MHNTTDKWKMGHGIFMKRGSIILLIFKSQKKINNLPQIALYISFRIVDLIIIIILFTIKLVLYFKMFKHVSRTLDISTLNETTSRRKLKRVKLIFLCPFLLTNQSLLCKASFFNLWTNILEVLFETFVYVFVSIFTILSFGE